MSALPDSSPGFASIEDLLSASIDARWPDDASRTNNSYFIDSRSRIKQYMAFRPHSPMPQTLASATALMQEYLDYRRFRGKSPQTIDNDRRTLSTAWDWAQSRGLLPFKGNPCAAELLHCPATVTRCRPPVHDAMVTQMLDLCRQQPWYPQLLLCLGAGMRPCGACRVQIEDVNLLERTVRVMEKRRERIVPLSAWLCGELEAWLGVNYWKQHHKCTVMHELAALRKLHGIPNTVTLQAMRRTFLKRCFDRDLSPQKAAAICGNSLVTIQKHYVQMETLSARSVVDKIDFGG